jgi:hypothetical protein
MSQFQPAFNDGGPVFPQHSDTCQQEGLTLRDFFAGCSLIGIRACPDHAPSNQVAAAAAYKDARAMLEERERTCPTNSAEQPSAGASATS